MQPTSHDLSRQHRTIDPPYNGQRAPSWSPSTRPGSPDAGGPGTPSGPGRAAVASGRRATAGDSARRVGRPAPDHGYAMTCHKAQGATVEIPLLYGAGVLTREAATSHCRAVATPTTFTSLATSTTVGRRPSRTTGTSTGSPVSSPSGTTAANDRLSDRCVVARHRADRRVPARPRGSVAYPRGQSRSPDPCPNYALAGRDWTGHRSGKARDLDEHGTGIVHDISSPQR